MRRMPIHKNVFMIRHLFFLRGTQVACTMHLKITVQFIREVDDVDM